MKLYSYGDFKKHPKFSINVGLCENVFIIYKLSESNLGITVVDYLLTTMLRIGYPIGINGYNKRYSHDYSISDTGMQLYNRMRKENSLYIGMQDALRHNLYHKYCLWRKANNPDVIYPAPIDFL